MLEVRQHAVAQHRVERESTEDLTGSFARALDQAYSPSRALFLRFKDPAGLSEHRSGRVEQRNLVALPGKRDGLMTRPAANIGDPGRRLGHVCAELPGD